MLPWGEAASPFSFGLKGEGGSPAVRGLFSFVSSTPLSFSDRLSPVAVFPFTAAWGWRGRMNMRKSGRLRPVFKSKDDQVTEWHEEQEATFLSSSVIIIALNSVRGQMWSSATSVLTHFFLKSFVTSESARKQLQGPYSVYYFSTISVRCFPLVHLHFKRLLWIWCQSILFKLRLANRSVLDKKQKRD